MKGNLICDSADVLFEMALSGHGIVRLADFLVGKALADGRLVELFTRQHVSEPVPLWAVMPPGRHRAPRVQVFVDFLARSLERPE